MRTEHLVFSLCALLFCTFLIGCGLFFLFITEPLLNPRMLGLFFCCSGAFLLLIFFFLSKRRFLLLQMGGVSVHECVLRAFAYQTLQELFPSSEVACEVIIHKKRKVEILANIPYLSEKNREHKLREIETHLTTALLKQCGWKEPFIFNVSFT